MNLSGYVEWMRDEYLIADGQRVRWNDNTRLELGRIPSVRSIPLGYEVKVKGVRDEDGSLLAQQLEAKPNGIAAYENEVREASDEMEAAWMSNGAVFQIAPNGTRSAIGQIVDSGPDADRVRRVVNRLVPPYIDATRLRVHHPGE